MYYSKINYIYTRASKTPPKFKLQQGVRQWGPSHSIHCCCYRQNDHITGITKSITKSASMLMMFSSKTPIH